MAKWKFNILFVVCLIISNVGLPFVNAQGSLQGLKISSVDSTEYPNIEVIFRAISSDNSPITDLTPQAIHVTENGENVNFSMEPYTAGIRVVFIIDSGLGINSVGSTGDSRLSEMKSVIKSFLAQMNSADSVMILAQEGDKTNVVSNYSSSTTDIQTAIDSYSYNATQASSGYLGILSALSQLSNQTDGKVPFIVFLSSGIQNATPESYTSIVTELSAISHPAIYTFLFRAGDDGFGSRLLELAKLGGGDFSIYRSKETASSLFQSFDPWRYQYKVSYRSPNATNGNRQVVVTTSGNNAPASATYSISLQPPKVTIQEPTTGATITRKAGVNTQGENMIGTDFTSVRVLVEWPDGHPRKLTKISVVVNNQTEGVTTNPNIDSSGIIQVPWDLRSYSQIGQNSISIQVTVTDELGMSGSSISVPVIISIQADICKNLPGVLCPIVVTISPYMQFVATGLALLALILVIVFRRKIASVGVQINEGVREVIDRVTKKRTVTVPKAYLEALEGVHTGRTTFEIYGNTPIGRSKRHAELIFQGTDDESPISRLHCTILEDDGVFSIRDEDSQWGTYLNGKKLESLDVAGLQDGDIIELAQVERGGIRLRFSLANPSDTDNYLSGGKSKDSSSDDDIRITKPRRK